MQPQIAVALALANGSSMVTESILRIDSSMLMSLTGWVLRLKLRAIQLI